MAGDSTVSKPVSFVSRPLIRPEPDGTKPYDLEADEVEDRLIVGDGPRTYGYTNKQ